MQRCVIEQDTSIFEDVANTKAANPDQHVEIYGRLRDNDIVFGDGEVMDPGGRWILAQWDLGNLFSRMLFSALPDNLVGVACIQP